MGKIGFYWSYKMKRTHKLIHSRDLLTWHSSLGWSIFKTEDGLWFRFNQVYIGV
jgi:hypothetical protein